MDVETIAQYRVLRRLGSGGMGNVYLAEDTRLNRFVALKLADQKSASRASREAKAAAVLSHPNIAQIFDTGIDGELSFIAMEYVEGETLERRIERLDLSIPEIVDIGRQIADALNEAHDHKLIHRDIKPANIMITARGLVKVLDFGLVKADRHPAADGDSATQTSPGVVIGTISYMSPEQSLGRNVDARSDIFSLGVVLYQMVTRRLPFQGANTAEVLQKIVNTAPVPMARFNYDLPVELERIVRKCLEKDPNRRYQSAREVEVDLRNLQRDSGPRVEGFQLYSVRRKIVVYLISAAAVLYSAAKLIELFRPSRSAPPPAVLQSVSPNVTSHIANPIAIPGTRPLLDNGCRGTRNELKWEFDWDDVPMATFFHLQVRAPMGGMMIDEQALTTSRYTHTASNYFVAESSVSQGWAWRVRAQVNGAWTAWSPPYYFDIEPLNTDCGGTPPIDQVIRRPIPSNTNVIASPGTRPLLDNGCVPPASNGTNWAFDWDDVPGASMYHILVAGSGARVALIDDSAVPISSYRYQAPGFIADINRVGWTWRVRAKVRGTWTEWSGPYEFDVEPPNTDCP